jgi:signal peptidase I
LRQAVRILINIDLVLSILLLFAVLVAPPLTGLTLEPVLSGSMEPTIHTGALIAIARVSPDQIQVGDIIGFHVQGMDTPVCHRVTGINGTGNSLMFQTKGDANEGPDDWLVRPQDIIGKVYFNVAWLGVVAKFVKSPLGFILLMGVPAAVVIGMELNNLFRPAQKKRKRPNLRQKPGFVPYIIIILAGVVLVIIPWVMMTGNATSRTLGALAGDITQDLPLTANRNMQNKGMIPLIICLSSSDRTVEFSESHFRLLPGEDKEVTITGTNPQTVIRTAGLFPLLPRELLYGLFVWEPRLGPLTAVALWVVPFTAAAIFVFRLVSHRTKPVVRAKYLKGVLSHG